MATRVSHPIFAGFYGVMSAGAEKAGAAEHRRELLSGLRGRVIEPGATLTSTTTTTTGGAGGRQETGGSSRYRLCGVGSASSGANVL
jgi:hypothetical protein